MEKGKENKNIEVVSGDGKDLNISPVYNHIPISKPKIRDNSDKKIVIPTEKKRRRKAN